MKKYEYKVIGRTRERQDPVEALQRDIDELADRGYRVVGFTSSNFGSSAVVADTVVMERKIRTRNRPATFV